MKLGIMLLIGILTSGSAFADQRIFDCDVTQINFLWANSNDSQLDLNPKVIFRDGRNWSLQVGDFFVHSKIVTHPAILKKSSIQGDQVVYDFWVDGSYEYSLHISVVDHTAQLYWWGQGEERYVASLQCEVVLN